MLTVSQYAAHRGLRVRVSEASSPKLLLLAVLLAAPFLAVMDGFVVIVAAPSIRSGHYLHLGSRV